MNLGLKNKVALIGGASKGLGKACAIQLANEGVDVAIVARGFDALQATAKSIRDSAKVKVLAIQADLSKIEDVKKIVNETRNTLGDIDILVVNSGGPPAGGFFDISEQNWRDAYNSVLYYVIELYRLIIPRMKERNWGRIINIASLSLKEPDESLLLSNVFRSGVVSMAKSLSRDLIKNGITINNICPGAFMTDRAIELMKKAAEQENTTFAEIEKETIKNIPLGRYQKPEELGALVAFLCSELSGGTTGVTIQIDGGIQKCLF